MKILGVAVHRKSTEIRSMEWSQFTGVPAGVWDILRQTAANPQHLLLLGQPGVGKTDLAIAYAADGGSRRCGYIHASDVATQGLLVHLLTRGYKAVVIDDIHLLRKQFTRMLYVAIEQGQVGGRATNTAIVATSNDAVEDALQKRFTFVLSLAAYPTDTVTDIVLKHYSVSRETAARAALYASGVPRVALKLVKAAMAMSNIVTPDDIDAMAVQRGFLKGSPITTSAIRVVLALYEAGKPVGRKTLADTLDIYGMNAVATAVRLAQQGFVRLTGKGVELTGSGYDLAAAIIQKAGGDEDGTQD